MKKTVAAICLHVPEMSTERFKWSFIARHERNEYNELHMNLPLNCASLVFSFTANHYKIVTYAFVSCSLLWFEKL